MIVEMNPPISRIHARSDSLRRESISSRSKSVNKAEDGKKRISDEVHSLNSWSDSLNLSTSSSSESGSRHSSSLSRHGSQRQEDTSTTKVSHYKVSSCKEEPKPGKGISHSRPKESNVSSTSRNCEVDTLSLNSFDYVCDLPDQECYSLNNYRHMYDTTDQPPCNVSHDVFKENVPAGTHGTIKTPSLYPDLSHLYQEIQGTSKSAQTHLTNSNIKSEPATNQPQRPHFFDASVVGKYRSSSELKSEISPECLHFYTANKTERIPHNGSAASRGEKLHRSQPSIPSEPLLKPHPKSSADLESWKKTLEHQFEPFKSLWNNFMYGWTFKSKPSIKYDSPLFMLGKCYHRRKDDPNTEPEESFLKDFASRIWLTYRSNFYPIPGTKLSSDCGWGCMLRSGQMLVAQCLVTHYLGRAWRLYDKQTETQATFYREILRWFSDPIDSPSDKTPFCLHLLANFGRTYNKDPGKWYGPASVAYIFRDAFTRASQTIPILSQLCIYVAQDCTVYIDDVVKLCTTKTESVIGASDGNASQHHVDGATASSDEDNIWLKSVIILIPMRLGGEEMNEIYVPCVKSLLSHESCMGIIGGKPKHSLYFLGWQDDKFIYLDPHFCRDAVDTTVKDFRIETYHCMTPRKLSISKMDPSCTVGFYIRNREEFNRFVHEIQEFVCPPKQKGTYPLFIFSGGSHQESSAKVPHPSADRKVKVTHYYTDENGQKHRTFSQESEEFVML